CSASCRFDPEVDAPVKSTERPFDHTPIHTGDLPATPQRERTIHADAWIEAPPSLHELGADIDQPDAGYLRRIHGWLLWRAGPPTHGDARYLAIAVDDLAATWTFRLFPDGTGEGEGPDGAVHTRFRTWKEALRDHGRERSK
ncbi:MAG: hypothetical protein ABWY80_03775, partial [Acidimicrobiia bacterium]